MVSKLLMAPPIRATGELIHKSYLSVFASATTWTPFQIILVCYGLQETIVSASATKILIPNCFSSVTASAMRLQIDWIIILLSAMTFGLASGTRT